MGLRIEPITLRDANAYVNERHRHSKQAQGHKFSVALKDDTGIRGVAIAGRPVARRLDDGLTLEILRVCTDGVPNGCSKLYAACVATGKGMGYRKFVTYTLASENGASVKAAGFTRDGESPGGSWSTPSRPREDKHDLSPKVRWVKVVG